MKVTATFSNGFTDTYQGARNVKAAWMVTENETGRVVASGHSLSREHADKTARASLVLRQLPHGWTKFKKDIRVTAYAKLHGFNSAEEMEAAYKRESAEYAAKMSIEVVEL
jgi:hypothetical protein